MKALKTTWRTKGKWLVLLTVVLLLVVSILGFVGCNKQDPDTGYSQGLTYEFNDEDKTASVTGIGTCKDTDLVIPSNVDGYTVTKIASKAFRECYLTAITIPDSVTEVGEDAFKKCHMEKATIPAMVCDSIAKSWALQTVVITGSGAIKERALAYYGGLREVTICDGVTSIGESAFEDCDQLHEISIAPSVTSIGESAFYWCKSLSKVNISDVAAWCNVSFANNTANPISYAKSFFLNGKKVTDLVIPDGVTAINDFAFVYCQNLTSVTLPNSVTSIGYCAFYECGNLLEITIPNSVTDIGDSAFYECKNLLEITIPNGITSIGNSVFCGCSNLNKVTLPNGLTKINESAFSGCDRLINIILPDSLTGIGSKAFYACHGLTNITIPQGVTGIGSEAFEYCSKLVEVYNKSSLMIAPGNDAYGQVAKYAKNVYTNEGNSKISTDSNGFVVYTDSKEKIVLSYLGNQTDIVLPSDTTSIIDYAFYKNPDITSVTIPEGVTSIGSSAFYDCRRLTSVKIPSTVTTIGNTAFARCYRLAEVRNLSQLKVTKESTDNGWLGYYAIYITTDDVPSKITTDSNGFAIFDGETLVSYNGDKTDVVIPSNVTAINNYAFYNCSNVVSLTIPNGVTSIGENSFEGCNVQHATLSTYAIKFIPNGNLKTVKFTGGDKIVSYALRGASNLTSVTFCNTIKYIESSAFMDCSALTSLIIPNSVKHIGLGAFEGCDALQEITLPFVGGSAGKTSSDTYQYPLGYIFGVDVHGYGTKQVYYYDSLNMKRTDCFDIPASLTKVTVTAGNILEGAFYGCNRLTDVTLCEGVTSIERNAFYGSSALKNLTIPDSVKNIGYNAFYGCGGSLLYNKYDNALYLGNANNPYVVLVESTDEDISSCTMHPNTKFICNGAFSGCENLTSVTMPDSLVSVGLFAFNGCNNLEIVNVNDLSAWCNISFAVDKNNFAVDSYSSNPLYYGTLCRNDQPVKDVVISKTATQIKDYVFWYMDISNLTIPESVTNVSENAFYHCTAENATLPLRHLDAIDQTKLKTVTFTSGTSIKEGAFRNCENLTSVTLPEGLNSIGVKAFSGCGNLQSINVPNSVTSIGERAFLGCDNLKSINIPNGVTTIEESTFGGCDALTNVVLPEGVIIIGDYAFNYCGLTEVTIPASVKSIGSMAFFTCSKLEKVNYLGTIDQWAQITFENTRDSSSNPDKIPYSNPLCYAKELYVEGKLVTEANITATKINDYAFYNYRKLEKLTIPSGTTSIGSKAFYYCTALKTVMIGSNVTSIGDGAFGMCDGLTAGGKVYYGGTEAQCNSITVGSNNSYVVDAPRYYYSQTEPTTSGNFWHYAEDGTTILIWDKKS